MNCSTECPDSMEFYVTVIVSVLVRLVTIMGCLGGKQNDTDGVCYHKQNVTYCCANYIYLLDEDRCKECVGRFGVNCTRECPRGYYGKQCNEECSCEAILCDKVWGCLSPTGEMPRNKQEELEWVFRFVLPASLSAIVSLVVIGLGIAYRNTKKITAEISIANNSTNDDNEESGTTDIYTAVVHPTRKPVRGMQQNDITYDNTLLLETQHQEYRSSSTLRRQKSITFEDKQIIEDINSPYNMSIGLEDAYDGTAYIPSSSDIHRDTFDIKCCSMDNYDVTLYDEINFEGDCVAPSQRTTENQLEHKIDA